SLTVETCTISGNSCRFVGGGIGVRGTTAAIRNSTIAFNTVASDDSGSGGGIFVQRAVDAPSALTLQGTIVAENKRGAAGLRDDIFGTVAASANNLVGDGTGLLGTAVEGMGGTNGNLIGTAADPINPLLAPLADNGGPTRTHALLPGSPAINAGFNFAGSATDQRGALRTAGGGTDIGAFEVQLPAPAPAPTPTPTPTTSPPPPPPPPGVEMHMNRVGRRTRGAAAG